MQRTPAGFPSGMPGIGEEIEGAMQQAPQPDLHFIFSCKSAINILKHNDFCVILIKKHYFCLNRDIIFVFILDFIILHNYERFSN